MGFLAILNAYTMRISLNVAITQLVMKKNHTDDDEGDLTCSPDVGDGGSEVSEIKIALCI